MGLVEILSPMTTADDILSPTTTAEGTPPRVRSLLDEAWRSATPREREFVQAMDVLPENWTTRDVRC